MFRRFAVEQPLQRLIRLRCGMVIGIPVLALARYLTSVSLSILATVHGNEACPEEGACLIIFPAIFAEAVELSGQGPLLICRTSEHGSLNCSATFSMLLRRQIIWDNF